MQADCGSSSSHAVQCRLADVLYQFLPGEALCSTPTTSFLGFLVLIKQTVKAATLLKAGEKHVQELLLMPISGSSSWGSINLLEVSHHLILCVPSDPGGYGLSYATHTLQVVLFISVRG